MGIGLLNKRAIGLGIGAILTIGALTNWRVLAADRLLGSAADVYDVAIVPGCHTDGLNPAPMLAARLTAALDLYQAHRVRRVLVSGDARALETAAMKRWLEARGVPSSDVLVDGDGTRTLATMQNAADRIGVRRAVICTQKLHMARALYLAEAAGISAVGFEAGVDASGSLKWQAIEALKRTVAFAETSVGGWRDEHERSTVVAAR